MLAVPFVCVPCRHPSGALIHIFINGYIKGDDVIDTKLSFVNLRTL
jgi:hypothetical protein